MKKILKCLASVVLMTSFLSLGLVVFAEENDFGVDRGGRLINVEYPVNDTDAANKKYVDDSVGSLQKPPAVLQTLGESKTATLSQKAISDLINRQALVDLIYPVGAIFMSVNSTDPSFLFGGTWEIWGSGRVPVGVDTSQSYFDSVEKVGGSTQLQAHNHEAWTDEQGGHTHNIGRDYDGGSGSSRWTVHTAGTSGAGNTSPTDWNGGHGHNVGIGVTGGGNSENLQPYITCFMWKRVS